MCSLPQHRCGNIEILLRGGKDNFLCRTVYFNGRTGSQGKRVRCLSHRYEKLVPQKFDPEDAMATYKRQAPTYVFVGVIEVDFFFLNMVTGSPVGASHECNYPEKDGCTSAVCVGLRAAFTLSELSPFADPEPAGLDSSSGAFTQ